MKSDAQDMSWNLSHTHFPLSNSGSGFFLDARIWGESLVVHSPPALFFFFKVRSARTLIPLFTPGSVHSGSASWDDCSRVFHDESPDSFPHYYLVSIVSLLWLFFFFLVKCVWVFRWNLQPAPLVEQQGSFTCHCGDMGWNEYWIEVSTDSSFWRKKILLLLLLGFEPITFWSQAQRST